MVIYWPSPPPHLSSISECQTAAAPRNIDLVSFESLLDKITSEDSLEIVITSYCTIYLSTPIHIKRNGCLISIRGLPEEEVIISSDQHSMFTVGGHKAKLVLENLTLIHTCAEEDPRKIGGVLFCRDTGSIEATKCRLTSHAGFACWLIQRGNISLDDCTAESLRRSGCVVFGKSSLTLNRCIVQHCFLHGICIRGTATLLMKSSTVRYCGVRAIYAYHSVSITLMDSDVDCTGYLATSPRSYRLQHDLVKPAIDIRADTVRFHQDKSLRLHMIRCCVRNNLSHGLAVTGVVAGEVISCSFRRNGCLNPLEEETPCSFKIDFCGAERLLMCDHNLIITTSSLSSQEQYMGESNIGCQIVWQYHADGGQKREKGFKVEAFGAEEFEWHDFDERSSKKLEVAYRDGYLASLSAKTGDQWKDEQESTFVMGMKMPGGDYNIDFRCMTQTNKVTFFERSIRRVALNARAYSNEVGENLNVEEINS